MELIKPIVKVGNSAGVILPKEFLHGRAKIKIVEKPIDVKRDILEMLDPYLEDVAGVYLYGSRARNEADKESDVDVLVITTKKIKIKRRGWEIIILEEKDLGWVFKNHPIMMYSIIAEAKPIINSKLLDKLKEKYRPRKENFREFVNDTKRMAKVNGDEIKIDKKECDILIPGNAIAYSLILRLRGMFIMKMLLEKNSYSHKQFKLWLINEAKLNKKDLDIAYKGYEIVKNDKKIKVDIQIEIAEKLLALLKKEIKKYG